MVVTQESVSGDAGGGERSPGIRVRGDTGHGEET